MGLGFHLYVEQRIVGDTWRAVRGTSQYHMQLAEREKGRYGELDKFFTEEGENRLDWMLFNEDSADLWAMLLPNIKNTAESELKGIHEVRGLPEDISAEIKDITDMWSSVYYGFSASHCTAKELFEDRPDLWTQMVNTTMHIPMKDYIEHGHDIPAKVEAYESKNYLGVNPRTHSELDVARNEERMLELFSADYVFTYGSFPLYHVYRPFFRRVITLQEQLKIAPEDIRFVFLLED